MHVGTPKKIQEEHSSITPTSKKRKIVAKEKLILVETTNQSKEEDVTAKKVKTKTNALINTKEKVDKEIEGVLMNLGTHSASLVKKNAQEGKEAPINKIKTGSQVAKHFQIQISKEKRGMI